MHSDNYGGHRGNMYNFVATTVPGDGPTPLGARASSGRVMARFESRLFAGPALEGSTYYC